MKTNFSVMLCGYILIFIMMTLMSVSGAHGRCYNETRMGRNATTLQRLTLAANVMASLSSIMVSLMLCFLFFFKTDKDAAN